MTFLLWLMQEEGGSGGVGPKDIVQGLGLHLGARDYLLLTILIAVVSSVVQLFFKSWLEESIKDRFAKELENYKRDLARRDQAAKVAELLATVQTGKVDDIAKANQLSWEMSLWLPPELAKSLARVLARAPGADSTKLLLEVRKVLLGLKEADITENDIATFDAPAQKGS